MTPFSSSISGLSTPSSSPAACARRRSTPRSSRTPCRPTRCWPASPPRSSSPAARRASTRPGAPQLDASIFDGSVPVFGICYGFMAMAQALGGDVARTGQREYGRTAVSVLEPGTLLTGLPDVLTSWMSHGDEVVSAPDGFTVNARSPRATVAAFEDVERRLAGVQWHPEVMHSEHGQAHPRALPGRHRRLRPDVDERQHRRGAGRAHPRAGRRRARHLRRCPAASTPPSPQPWSSERSATS